jgi:hypothetical protein
MLISRFVPAALALSLATVPSLQAAERVRVTNFPRVQRVEVDRFPEVQAVTVKDHPPATGFTAWKGLRVAPVSPSTGSGDLERFHELGRLDAAGFASLSVSAAGSFQGTPAALRVLELVLLPDTTLIRDAWKDDGVLLLEQRIELELQLEDRGLFQAAAAPVALRFPQYLAFLRNRSTQAVEMDLYLQWGE